MVHTALVVTALGSGLMAGVFFAFSCFVMAALRQIPAPAGIAAMQMINITVINAVFMAAFLGTAILCALLSVSALLGWIDFDNQHVLGCLTYLVGTFGVTIACNVPRNDRLATVDGQSDDGADYWRRYLSEWTWWNHVRTACALLAAGLLVT